MHIARCDVCNYCRMLSHWEDIVLQPARCRANMIAPLIKSVHVGYPRNSTDFASTLKRTWREALCGGWCCNMMIDVGPPFSPLHFTAIQGTRETIDRLRASYWPFMKVSIHRIRSTPAVACCRHSKLEYLFADREWISYAEQNLCIV